MILQCTILFTFLAAGELIVMLTGLPIPSSIIGMILLTIALETGVIKEHWVSRIADFLVDNIAFFFVPAGIGVMQCTGLIKGQLVPILMATIISTVFIITVTGWVHRITRKYLRK